MMDNAIPRRALAQLLKVPEDEVTTDDPHGKLWTHGKTDYACFSSDIVARDFVPVGCRDGFHFYRIK